MCSICVRRAHGRTVALCFNRLKWNVVSIPFNGRFHSVQFFSVPLYCTYVCLKIARSIFACRSTRWAHSLVSFMRERLCSFWNHVSSKNSSTSVNYCTLFPCNRMEQNRTDRNDLSQLQWNGKTILLNNIAKERKLFLRATLYYFVICSMQSNCSNSTLQAVESSCLSLKTSASLLLPHLLSAHSSLSTTPHIHAGISPLLCAHHLMETCRYLALCVETLCLSAQVGLYTYVTGRKSNKLYIYRRHMSTSAHVRACNCTICSN